MHNFAVAFKQEPYINIIIDDSEANGSQLSQKHKLLPHSKGAVISCLLPLQAFIVSLTKKDKTRMWIIA